MDTSQHTMQALFAQLGLADDEASIQAFICSHRPLPLGTRIHVASFWTPSQSALIKEKLKEDGDWSQLVDSLDSQLREHPDSDALALGAARPC